MGYLGCADSYRVEFSTFDQKLIGSTDRISSVNWNRKLDDYSSSGMTFDLGSRVGAGACCELMEKINVRRDVCSIYRIIGSMESMVWTGRIMKITGGREDAVIDCVDDLGLYQTRILRNDHDDIAQDIATIWNSYLVDANSIDPIITTFAPLTGILLDRTVNAFETKEAYGDLKELLSEGLDFTIHRGTPIYGGNEIRLQRMALRDDNFVGDPKVIQDGSKVASQIYMKGNGDDRVDYPNPSATPATGYYGLVERVFNDDNLVGTASLTQAAQARYDILARQKPYYLDMNGASLAPSTPIDINDFVAGTVFNVSIQDTCPSLEQPLRMDELNVSMGTDESVSISLQPIGTTVDDL